MNPAPLYPPYLTSACVKATTEWAADWAAWHIADPNTALTGILQYAGWASAVTAPQRIHFDLGRAVIVTGCRYENGHYMGTDIDSGVQNFTLWGSNSPTDFAALTYGADGTWEPIRASASSFVRHVEANTPDPRSFAVDTAIPYRFIAFKFASNYGRDLYYIRQIILTGYDPEPFARLPLRGRC